MSNPFNLSFEFEDNEHIAAALYLPFIQHAQYQITLTDKSLIDRFGKVHNFKLENGMIKFGTSPDRSDFKMMESIAKALKEYLNDHDIIPDTPTGFTDEG
jgi:hypothetical protein